MSTLLSGTSCWVITDGKAGDLVQCMGIAGRLGLAAEQRILRPRQPWSWMAPRGPLDPREAPGVRGGPLAPPFPAIAIASGRRTVPALTALKRASAGRTFTVYLKDPHTGTGAADVIWVPEHDRLRGDNVIVTLTSPHSLTQDALSAARARPDVRLADLPEPRVAMVLGGASGRYRFTDADVGRLVQIAHDVLNGGGSLIITPSRRTPPGLVGALQAMLAAPANRCRLFVWDGSGQNPYVSMLALAQAIIVTGDSVNMLGEAAATGAPIHVVEARGGNPKVTGFIDRLVAHGAARRWAGRVERFTYRPIDATPEIALAIERRYQAFRRKTA